MEIKDYNGKLCSFKFYGHKCVDILIKINEYHVDLVYKTECIDNISYREFEHLIIDNLFGYKDFKLNKETTKNKAMGDLSIYDGKLCKFNYKRNSYENILIKITDNHVNFIHADGLKFMGLCLDLFTRIVNKHPNFSLIEDFKLTEDKTELKTVRDYYNKYNGKLCCFNNGNGTKKYRINVSLYNDSVYLNSNLNEIKYDESLCRKIDIHTFDYLLKNGKLLNKVITDFRLLEFEKKQITMKEISEMFNIHVNDIEIVK